MGLLLELSSGLSLNFFIVYFHCLLIKYINVVKVFLFIDIFAIHGVVHL